MTKRWILAAEADKIQDLVFRSSHLREVVGGSQLLSRFCQEGAVKLLAQQRGLSEKAVELDIPVADGGSFTILFSGEKNDEAIEFGQRLAQLYREVTGGTMTVAEPIEWSGEEKDFQDANTRSRLALARAKREGREPTAIEQMPYVAFCASCGVGLADTHEPLHSTADRANYLCPACRSKADERDDLGSRFISDFEKDVLDGEYTKLEWPNEADDLAQGWDPRNYVAYLVADGNGMGKIFNQCASPEKLHNLSKCLTNVLRQSLAAPARLLRKNAPPGKQNQLPVLPLILGGDDVFVLLPASYALDFARRFCLEYEERMKAELQKPEISITGVKPTMSVAVVVCKSKYPHTLAHKHGEKLLESAKRLAKRVPCEEKNSDYARSIVNFDVILGSRIAQSDKPIGFSSTLRPYWVMDKQAEHDELDQDPDVILPPIKLPSFSVGLPISRLIRQRYRLRLVPMRRLAQFRTLFARPPASDDTKDIGLWQAQYIKLLGRIAGRDSGHSQALEAAVKELGDPESWLQWYHVRRPGEEGFDGHGLPDLLEMWDFCWCLDWPRDDYLAREE